MRRIRIALAEKEASLNIAVAQRTEAEEATASANTRIAELETQMADSLTALSNRT